jgi:hypothetical protein
MLIFIGNPPTVAGGLPSGRRRPHLPARLTAMIKMLRTVAGTSSSAAYGVERPWDATGWRA